VSVQVSRIALTNTLSWVARALPTRSATPILSGIHITVKEGVLRASAFDYEQSASGTLPVTGDNLDVIVNGRLFADVVRSLGGQDVKLELSEDENRLVVESGRSVFGLPLMPLSEYPDLPDVPPELGTVAGSSFCEAIKEVAIATGNDTSVPVLTSVLMIADPEKGTLTMAATDRYRLGFTTITYTPAEGVSEKKTFLIPAKALESYAKSFTDLETVTMHHGGDKNSLFGVTGDQNTATTRLFDGQFPNYEPLIPTSFFAIVDVPKDDLIAAVKRVILVTDRSQAVKFTFEEGAVVLSAGSILSSAQSATETVEIDYTSEELVISFNPAFLLDGLANINTDNVRFRLVAAQKPALLSTTNDDDKYKYLLMPTRA